MPNFDKRLDQAKANPLATTDAAKQNAANVIRSRVKDVRIDIDEILDSPKFVASTREFLTGANGSGGAVSAAVAAAFPADDPHRGVKTFLTEHQALFGFGPEALAVAQVHKDYVSAPGTFRTVVWQQHVDDIPVFEGIFKAHLTKNGELINVGSQFVPDLHMALDKVTGRASLQTNPPISVNRAIVLAAANLGDVLTTNLLTTQDTPQGNAQFQHFRGFPILNNTSARLTWLPLDSSTLRLCWDISLESRARGELYRVVVDAVTGGVWVRHCLTDRLSDIHFNVWTGDSPAPLLPTLNVVSSYQPPIVPRTLVTLSALDTNASPAGWMNDGDNSTVGNNVDAHLDWNNDNIADPGTSPTGSPNRVFNCPADLTQQPSTYPNAAVVSLFYWNNWAHDHFYELGFTEAAGNFQASNFGRGGVGGDPVQADAQDSYALTPNSNNRNNSNFSTPLDGSSPRMQMYIYTGPSPSRDGDLDTLIMLHEYGHGVSTRLVGGGVGISALQTQGMGEGWSDFCALALLANPTNDPDANFGVFAYTSYQFRGSSLTNNYYYGNRRYPYSVNTNVNPLTFKDIDPGQILPHSAPSNPLWGFSTNNANEVHMMGEVWCATVWEARSRLCHKYGNAAGNQMMLQLVIDGMKLSPANPTFLQARNAILQADLVDNSGANQDVLWASFAKRGMGLSATSPANFTTVGVGEAFDTPSDTNAPVLAVTAPANNSALSVFTHIGGTAYDGGSGLQGNQIYFTLYNNGSFWSGTYWTNTLSTDPSILLTASVVNGVWTFTNVPTAGNQVQGTYYVSAFARDNAGNTSSAQSGVTSISFTLSTTPPNVAITFPLDGSTITNQLVGNWFQGTASGSFGIQVSISLFIRRNSDNLYWTGSGWGNVTNGFISNSYNSGNHTWQNTGPLPAPGSSLANGDYHFIAIAVDAAGNQQQVDSAVSVDIHPVFVFNYGSQFGPTPNMTWGDPANWDVGGVPDSNSMVVINGYTPNNTALGSVAVYRLDMSGGTLTTSGMLIHKLNLSGGEIHGGAINIDANGVFNWSGGTLSGIYGILSNAALNISGAADKYLNGGTINNAGTLTWTGAGQIQGAAGTVINNSGTFNVQNDAEFYNVTAGSPLPVINNSGTIRKTVATGATVIRSDNWGWVFANSGLVDIHTGVLSSRSQFNVNEGGSFSGDGVTRVDGGVATMSGSNYVASGGTFELANGTMNGTGTFNGPGNFAWSGGLLQGNDGIGSSGHLLVTGSAILKYVQGTFSNAGTGVWTGTGDINMSAGSVFNNSGTFTAQNAAQFYNYTGGAPMPAFNNSGAFIKTGDTNTTTFAADTGGVAFNNTGTATAEAGVLGLSGGGASSNATFNALAGARIEFNGGTHYFSGGLSFTGAGVTRIAGGTVNSLSGTNTVGSGGTFELASGYLAGVSGLCGPGMFAWTGGNLTAVLMLQSNLATSVAGAAGKYLAGGTINNAGTLTWTGAGQIQGAAGSAINNSGTFNIQNDSQFYNYTAGSPFPVINNSGAIRKTVATGETAILPDNWGWIFSNSGLVDIQTGVLSSRSQFNVNNGGSFSGSGVTRIDGGVATMSGTNGIASGGTFELAAAATLNGMGTFNGPGNFLWTGGSITAVLTLQTNLATSVAGAAGKYLAGGTLNHFGTLTWTGAGQIQGAAGSVINNAGTFNMQNDAEFYNVTAGSPDPVINNTGTIRKSVTTGNTVILPDNWGWVFANSGLIDIQTGVLSSRSQFNVNEGGSFSGAGVTRIDDGIATMNGSNSIAGGATFELASGTLNGTGTFNGPGNFLWTGGTVQGNDGIGSSGHLLMTGDATKQLLGTFSNAGTGIWSGTGDIDVSIGSVFNNSGTFTVQNSAQVYSTAGGSPVPVFNNSGAFIKTGDTGTTTFANPNSGVAFNNTGTATAETGALGLSGGGASSNATFNALTGARIEFSGGTHLFNGGLDFTGAGVTRITNGTVNSQSGTNTVGSGGTFELASGVLTGFSGIGGPGTFLWTGGNLTAVLMLQSNLSTSVAGAAGKYLAGGTINNFGTLTWTGAGQIQGAAGSAINNSGTFNIQNDSQFYNYTAGSPLPVINNTGTIRKTVVTGDTTILAENWGWVFSNSGLVDVQTGVLISRSYFNVNEGGSFSGAGVTRIDGGVATMNGSNYVASGGTFELASATMNGSGTFNGPGNFAWSGGTLQGANGIGSTGHLLVTGGAAKQLQGTFSNAGTGVWIGTGDIDMTAGSVFNSSGTFSAQNDAQFYNNTGGSPIPVVNNTGTFRKSSATGTTAFAPDNGGVDFSNTGTVDLRSGTLGIYAGYATSPSNQLTIAIGGLNAGTQFGTEHFSGAATFDGALTISLTNGFTPTNGQSFAIATYASHSGEFTATHFPPLPRESKWKLTYDVTSLVLQVLPVNLLQSPALTNNGSFQFTFVGEIGSACVVEASTNLVSWIPLLTNSPFNGSLTFVDLLTAQFRERFYRVTIFP